MNTQLKKDKVKLTDFRDLEDELIGKQGTPQREQYEFELKVEMLGEQLKQIRKAKHLTQEQLGKKLGVQKAQVSKLENNATNVTIGTFLKVLKALGAKADMRIEFAK